MTAPNTQAKRQAGGQLRVAVFGATGNIGTSTVEALSRDDQVGRVLGVARRKAVWSSPKLELVTTDLAGATEEQLDQLVSGVDVVIHLAWLFQPTHDPVVTWRTNVLGSIRLFEAVSRNQVPALVHSSSVGAYSPGPKDGRVTESWPTHGWPGAAYTREKSYLERVLDAFEVTHPHTRVVRIRPAFVFKREAAQEQRRLFAGPLLAGSLVRPSLIPFLPNLAGLRVQGVHSADVGEAFRLAAVKPVHGAFNIAADPVVDADLLAELLRARRVPVPVWPVRMALAAAWRLHAVPASPGLFDAVRRLPLMDTARAHEELGWAPRYTATQALEAFLTGLREGGGMATEPLAPVVRGGRLRELATGVGQRG